MPENEHLTMRLAEICGILIVNSSLIRLKSKELCYITNRIDREPHPPQDAFNRIFKKH